MTSTDVLSRMAALTNPEHGGSFWDDYVALLHGTVKAAIYRIVQGTVALTPVALGFWIGAVTEYPWTYMAATTATTTGLGIRNLIYPSRNENLHEIESK